MEPRITDQPMTESVSSWSLRGDPTMIAEAARRLRIGIENGVYRSHPPGEYAMFGLARLLDAVAFSMRLDGAVHRTVVSGAMEIAHHVLAYLHPGQPVTHVAAASVTNEPATRSEH